MANLNQDRVNVSMTTADVTAVSNAQKVVNDKVPLGSNGMPLSLTDEERDSFKSMDVDNKQFADEVLAEIKATGASILPPHLANPAPLENDITLYEQAVTHHNGALDNARRWEDVRRIVGSEGYGRALSIYNSYGRAAEDGVPGAQAAYDRLKQFFKKNNTSTPEPEV